MQLLRGGPQSTLVRDGPEVAQVVVINQSVFTSWIRDKLTNAVKLCIRLNVRD